MRIIHNGQKRGSHTGCHAAGRRGGRRAVKGQRGQAALLVDSEPDLRSSAVSGRQCLLQCVCAGCQAKVCVTVHVRHDPVPRRFGIFRTGGAGVGIHARSRLAVQMLAANAVICGKQKFHICDAIVCEGVELSQRQRTGIDILVAERYRAVPVFRGIRRVGDHSRGGLTVSVIVLPVTRFCHVGYAVIGGRRHILQKIVLLGKRIDTVDAPADDPGIGIAGGIVVVISHAIRARLLPGRVEREEELFGIRRRVLNPDSVFHLAGLRLNACNGCGASEECLRYAELCFLRYKHTVDMPAVADIVFEVGPANLKIV